MSVGLPSILIQNFMTIGDASGCNREIERQGKYSEHQRPTTEIEKI